MWDESVKDNSDHDQLNKLDLDDNIVNYFRKYLVLRKLDAHGGQREVEDKYVVHNNAQQLLELILIVAKTVSKTTYMSICP